jgi:hypothetical protein
LGETKSSYEIIPLQNSKIPNLIPKISPKQKEIFSQKIFNSVKKYKDLLFMPIEKPSRDQFVSHGALK